MIIPLPSVSGAYELFPQISVFAYYLLENSLWLHTGPTDISYSNRLRATPYVPDLSCYKVAQLVFAVYCSSSHKRLFVLLVVP